MTKAGLLGMMALLVSLAPTMQTPALAADYGAIVAAQDRSEADRQNDAKRNPVALLAFVGPQPGMRILDMSAGAGYSTELLARSVAPGGKVYAQADKPSEKFAARLATPAMSNVVHVVRPYDDLADPNLTNLDAITFFFGYHDTTFMPVDRAKMNKAMFDALKPGGVLVVADHSARPEDGASVGKTLHRIAEQTLRAEIESAGFQFVADANFLRHPEDSRTVVVFKNTVPNDEFVLKFRKP
ncbi:MAG: class I SAM-dependent methyltransferase [Rhodoblastus sp.]|jgi:predicted methyltransferase